MGSRKVNLIKGKNFSAVSDIFERGHHDWWVYGSAVGDESGQHLLFMKTKNIPYSDSTLPKKMD